MNAQFHPGTVRGRSGWFWIWLWLALRLAALSGQFTLQAAGCRGMLNLDTSRPILVDYAGLRKFL